MPRGTAPARLPFAGTFRQGDGRGDGGSPDRAAALQSEPRRYRTIGAGELPLGAIFHYQSAGTALEGVGARSHSAHLRTFV